MNNIDFYEELNRVNINDFVLPNCITLLERFYFIDGSYLDKVTLVALSEDMKNDKSKILIQWMIKFPDKWQNNDSTY